MVQGPGTLETFFYRLIPGLTSGSPTSDSAPTTYPNHCYWWAGDDFHGVADAAPAEAVAWRAVYSSCESGRSCVFILLLLRMKGSLSPSLNSQPSERDTWLHTERHDPPTTQASC
jgi:hypothetical protein